MSQFSKKFVGIVAVAAMVFTVAPVARAEESEGGKSITGFFRRLFNYPVKATQKTGEMTANTLNNTGEKVVSATGENLSGLAGGDLSKTGELVVDPVVGAANTVGQTASETVQIPVKAAEETPQAE